MSDDKKEKESTGKSPIYHYKDVFLKKLSEIRPKISFTDEYQEFESAVKGSFFINKKDEEKPEVAFIVKALELHFKYVEGEGAGKFPHY
jgi:hypothetical protein